MLIYYRIGSLTCTYESDFKSTQEKKVGKHFSNILFSTFITIITASGVSYANDIHAITEDGSGVVLHDDGTWEFADLLMLNEVKSEAQAKELVKNLACSRDGTVGQYLKKKAEASATEDMGWHVHPKEDGFEVIRLFLIRQEMESKYIWHVYKSGKIKPISSRAFAITKE